MANTSPPIPGMPVVDPTPDVQVAVNNSISTVSVKAGTLVDGSGNALNPASPRLRALARKISLGKEPVSVVVMGDSTSDETTEWFYKLGQSLSTGIGIQHSVAYRAWSDAKQQYSHSTAAYISTGPLGRQYLQAGSASTSHSFAITDSAQTSPVGDIDVRCLVNLMGGTFGTSWPLASKYGAAGQRSWRFEITPGNSLFFETSSDGTNQFPKTSSIALSGALLTDDTWIRATRTAATGSVVFYTSPDNATWTQLGTTQSGSASAIFDSTTDTRFPGRAPTGISNIGKDVRFFECLIYGSLDSTAMVAWIDCGTIPPRTSTTSAPITDDKGNAGLVLFGASTVVGSPRLCLFNASVGGQVIAYSYDAERFAKQAAGGVDAVYINYSHNEASVTAFGTPYKTLTDLIVALNRDAAIIGVLQNRRYSPATYIEEHERRLGAIALFCGSQGFDVLDFFGLVPSTMMKADGVHPDPALAGTLMGDYASRQIGYTGAWRSPA